VPGLGTSFGRGGATTAQWDLVNSDCILIQGSNMAECHPVGFRFVMEARERGAKIIHVDPRFTRTSANADVYAPIRPGTDIAFLGGLINYVLQHDLWFKEYVLRYTNASTIINDDFKDTEDLDGIFSGFDEDQHRYDPATWTYRGESEPVAAGAHEAMTGESYSHRSQRSTGGPPPRDETLQDPRCVFQILKRHFARYTPEMVERTCGMPQSAFFEVARAITENSGRDRTTAFCYAVGWTQHSVGVQTIRTAAILQLLLGNIGRPGGGIMALRGHAAIQGSTDIPTLYNLLPGYIQMPLEANETFADFLRTLQAPTGWWNNFPKYAVSLLKAFYGENATADNEWGYQYLPKLRPDDVYSYYPLFFKMMDGLIKGLFVFGENFAVGGPGSRLERNAMRKLEWCVVRDPFLVETAEFWKLDGVDPATVPTEVFYMPAAWAAEKDGSLTNTQRLLQWHEKALDPPGDARSETWFLVHLGLRLRELYRDSTLERDRPLQALIWDYPLEGALREPRAESVAEEISGYRVADGQQVAGYAELKDDGSTACGCWIYSGYVPEKGRNLSASRERDKPGEHTNHSRWAWSWPANRRILYNRASADPEGTPWSERKRLVWWDAARNEGNGGWTGYDVPDFEAQKAPTTAARPGEGMDAISGADPFIMQADGRAWLYAPHGLKDGPLPTHYEPLESPAENPLYPKRRSNPAAKTFNRADNPYNDNPYHGPPNDAYPYVLTTYRLTEHHTSGAMSRWVTWLSELQPELFAEIDPQLAAEKGVDTGDWVTLTTARAQVQARALVTNRMRPMQVDGKTVHVIGLPYHWGPTGIVTGDIVNDLAGVGLDPNVMIHEAKAFTCDLRKGQKSEGTMIASGGPHASVAEGGTVGRVASEGAEMLRLEEQEGAALQTLARRLRGKAEPEPSEEAAHPGALPEATEVRYD
jgi:formate dehydrogenase major subunit